MADNNNRNINFMLGQIKEAQDQIRDAQERAELDRKHMLDRIADIDEQFKVLNGRTKKLEDDNERTKLLWNSDTAQSVQVFNSNVKNFNDTYRSAKDWMWRVIIIIGVALIAGNQAAGKLIDYFIMKTGSGQ